MPRTRTYRVTCTQGDCPESGLYEYANQRELADLMQRQRTWRCTRHRDPETVLSPDNPARTTTLIARHGTGHSAHRLFWGEEGQERASHGFVHGPGFKAWAKDFPPGTRLVITVQVDLPDAPAS